MVVGSRIASVTGRIVSSKPEVTSTLASESLKPSPAPAQNPAPEIRQPVRVGASSTMVAVQAEAGVLNKEGVVTGQNQIAQNHVDLPIQGRSSTDLNVVKAKDPVPSQTAQNAAAPAIRSGTAMQTSSPPTIEASPRWTVGPAGTLQRSLDDGNTWQTVDPSTSLRGGMARAALNAQAGSEPTDQRNQKKLNGTANSAPSPNPIFRAVAALGPEVWAGASSGVLYHSSDGGNRWTLVTPSEGGAILTGDILSIQFADPQHGRITTSTAELWTTLDAGQTWHKQQ